MTAETLLRKVKRAIRNHTGASFSHDQICELVDLGIMDMLSAVANRPPRWKRERGWMRGARNISVSVQKNGVSPIEIGLRPLQVAPDCDCQPQPTTPARYVFTNLGVNGESKKPAKILSVRSSLAGCPDR